MSSFNVRVVTVNHNSDETTEDRAYFHLKIN